MTQTQLPPKAPPSRWPRRRWWALAGLGLAAWWVAGQLGGCYLMAQGQEQARLLLARRPVEEVLAGGGLAAGAQAKLRLVGRAKAFGAQALGLRVGDSYGSYVPLDRDAVSYVAAGAPRYGLAPHTWWFPLVGAVPYKGHFVRAQAEAEASALRAQGLDALVRPVAAFSLLGWVSDPVYEPMLAYDEAALVELILHELTHATLYLPGEAAFNEAFASHVGQAGAEAFFLAEEGASSAHLAQARASVRDRARFAAFLNRVVARLEAEYALPGSEAEKAARKAASFAWAKARFREEVLPTLEGRRFRNFDQLPLNNAWIASFRTYDARPERFAQAQARFQGELKATVAFFRDHVAKAPKPEAFLDAWLAQGDRPASAP